VQTIYSLTVNFIERFLANKNTQSEIDSLKAAFSEGRYTDALVLIDELILKSGLEIHDLKQRRVFVAELNFLAAAINFKRSNFFEAREGFIKCLSLRHLSAYSALFLAVMANFDKNYQQARGYIAQYAGDQNEFQYFKLLDLKILFEAGEYEKASAGAKKLIENLSAFKKDVKLLPPFEFYVMDAFYIKSFIESAFELSNFLFEILFIAAEADFNLERYESAFEYYKEASFDRREAGVEAECLYKMSCCKTRVADFITARGLLEKITEVCAAGKIQTAYYECALLDLANLYEYHFNEMEKAVKILIEYCAVNRQDSSSALRLASLLYETGRYNEAVIYLNDEFIRGEDNRFNLSLLTAKCYYSLKLYSRCLETLESFLSESAHSADQSNYQMMQLAAKAMIMLNKYDAAGQLVHRIKNIVSEDNDKFEAADFLMFYNSLNAAPCIIYVKADETAIFKGFIKHGRLEESCKNIEALKNFIEKTMEGETIAVVSGSVSGEDYLALREIFKDKIVIYEKHLSFINPDGHIIGVRDNPLEYDSIDPALNGFCELIRLLGRININNMPSLFVEARSFADGAYAGNYSGILRFYEYFKTSGRKFSIFSSYINLIPCAAPQASSKDDKSRLWPFIINFKNIDIFNGDASQERERALINGCGDIFLYNFLRERKFEIDGKTGIHIFAETAKTGHIKKILEFILKKLGYMNSEIFEYNDISDIFCIKKVNGLLSGEVSNERESFDILSMVLAMSSASRFAGNFKAAINENLCGRVKFSFTDCDYHNCAERKICKIKDLMESYDKPGKVFMISPFANFLFINAQSAKPEAFIDFDQLFLSVPGFYLAARDFYSESVPLGYTVSQIDKILSDWKNQPEDGGVDNHNLTVLSNLSMLLKSVNKYFSGFFDYYDGAELIKKICRAAVSVEDALKNICGGQRARLDALIKLSKKYLIASSFVNFSIKARLKDESGSISLVITDESRAAEIIFDRSVKKIYFTNEEDPGQYYENKISGLFKFFKRFNITEKYFQAAAINANILVQSENQPGYKNIINKFISNSKKTAVFFLNCRRAAGPELMQMKRPGPVYNYISLPSGVEAELVDLDCVVINYHYENKDHARSVLSMFKNIIVKYNANIFWMMVSTELFENVFARGSDFMNMERVKFYSNEIEYINAFYGESENLKFLDSPSPVDYYDNAGAPEILDKHDIFHPEFRLSFYKFWRQAYENIIEPKIKTLCADTGVQSEKAAFILTLMALYTGFKKHVIICADSIEYKSRFGNFLYCSELFNDYYISERERVIIGCPGEYDKIYFQRKGIRDSEVLLINYQQRRVIFNSIDFSVIEYEKWVSFSSRFDNFLNIVSVCNPDEFMCCASYEDFYFKVSQKIKEKEENGVHIICAPREANEVIYERITALLKREIEGISLLCIAYENAAAVIDNIIALNAGTSVCVYIAGSDYNDMDMRIISSCAAQFAPGAAAGILKYRISPAGRHLKMPEVFYSEAAFVEALITQIDSGAVTISLDELSTYLPASVFSKSSASRCLALLSNSGALKLSDVSKTHAPPEVYTVDAGFLSDLRGAGAIAVYFNPASGEKYDFMDLLRRGLVVITDRCELIDRFYRVSKDMVEIGVKIIEKEFDVFEFLKKMAKVRKTMLRCLYDIEGFREGRPIILPISDFHDLSVNDFYYMREFTFLHWHKACVFLKSEANAPQIKRILSQIQIERVTENLEHDLSEFYTALRQLNEESKLAGIKTLPDLFEAVKNAAGRRQFKLKDAKSIAGLLKLLKHLFLYGLINLKASVPFEIESYDINIETVPGRKMDYKSFIRSYENMYKI
jgi:hypothetical protein